jgi:hypothetical protein
VLNEHYHRIKNDESVQPLPSPGCPECSGPFVETPLRASGGYTEVSLQATCCPRHRVYWVVRENGAKNGTVQIPEGPWRIELATTATPPQRPALTGEALFEAVMKDILRRGLLPLNSRNPTHDDEPQQSCPHLDQARWHCPDHGTLEATTLDANLTLRACTVHRCYWIIEQVQDQPGLLRIWGPYILP